MANLYRIHFIGAFLILFLISSNKSSGQDSTKGTWSLSTYADVYYSYATDSMASGKFQQFPTVSPRSNSFGLNVLQFTTQYSGPLVRATATLQAGDIPLSAWSGTYNAIQEAHVGLKLLKTLWIDAGFFKTHFGTESLMPKDNLASSLAIATYYEPYYESGIRLNFDPTDKLEINGFLLNGYNLFEDNNRKKSVGLGVTYAINDKTGIGYTNYLGDDSPDSSKTDHTRFANNLFVNYGSDKLKIQAGIDYYIQQNSDLATGSKTASAFGGLATIKYLLHPKFGIYARYEIFQDPDGFLTGVITNSNSQLTGYKVWGLTGGIEFKPAENAYVRLEGRYLQMDKDQDIFRWNSENQNSRFEIMIHTGFYFDLVKK